MRRAALLLPLLTAATAACTHCGEGGVRPTDASAGGPIDAGRRRDAADAKADVDLGEAGPGFRIYTELPDCDLQVAIDPQAVASKIAWIPCPGKGSSCRQIDMNGWEWDETLQAPPNISYARTSPGGDYLTLAHQVPITQFDIAVYELPQYSPIQVWRTATGKCSVLPIFGRKMGALVQTHPTIATVASGDILSVLANPAFAPLAPAVPALEDIAFESMSDTTLSFDIQPLHEVARMPVGSTNYVYTKGLKLSEPIVVGDDVFAHHEYGIDGWSGLVRVNADGTTTGYRYVAQRHIYSFRADANWALWVETFGDPNYLNFDQPNAELWGAPYTNDPSTLASTAKKIATLPGVLTGVGDPAYSGGYYAIYASLSAQQRTTLYVVRVSDGTVKTLDTNALIGPDATNGYYIGRIASISSTEITGILAKVNLNTGFGFVRLQLGPW